MTPAKGRVLRSEVLEELDKATRSDSKPLGDDDDARKRFAGMEPLRDVTLRTLVAGDPDAAVAGAVGEHLRIVGPLSEGIDDSDHFPSGVTSGLDVSLGPVFVGEDLEPAGHYRPERRSRSASLAAPSAATRSAITSGSPTSRAAAGAR